MTVWVQAPAGAFIGARGNLSVKLYGVPDDGSEDELAEDLLPWQIDAGILTEGIAFDHPAIWSSATSKSPDNRTQVASGARLKCDELIMSPSSISVTSASNR